MSNCTAVLPWKHRFGADRDGGRDTNTVVIKDYNATAERFYQMYGFNQTAATGAAGGRSHGQSVVSLGDEIGVMRTGLDTDFIKCDPPDPFQPGDHQDQA